MIAGSYKTNTGANAKGHFLGVQVFADGTVFNTRGWIDLRPSDVMNETVSTALYIRCDE